jgi:hypothetical protein
MALPPPLADNPAVSPAFLPGWSCKASAPPKGRSYSGRTHSERQISRLINGFKLFR